MQKSSDTLFYLVYTAVIGSQCKHLLKFNQE